MMDDGPYPSFVDVEASGFGPESYPIAVAWNDPRGEIQRLLIDPRPVPAWQQWDAAAEAVHGIERERLERNGWPPDYVVDRLNQELNGQTVYSDAPDFDAAWLRRLFSAVGQPLAFSIAQIDDLLIDTMRGDGEPIWRVVLRIAELKREIAAVSSGKHDAGYDVGYLLQLWRAAAGHQVKMNHGIGPLPATSATGTFLRLKQRHAGSAPPAPR
jgi:ribosomal protein S18 acetylase RimI-like enzyme